MRFLPLLVLLAALVGPPAAAAAELPCERHVIEDWKADGVINYSFPADCYRRVLAALPGDARAYSSFATDVRAAIIRDRRKEQQAAAERRRQAAAAAAAAAAEGRRAPGGGANDPAPTPPGEGRATTPSRAGSEPDFPTAPPTTPPIDASPETPTAEPAPSELQAVEQAPVPVADGEAGAGTLAAPFDPFGGPAAPDDGRGASRGVLATAASAVVLAGVGIAGLGARRRRAGLR